MSHSAPTIGDALAQARRDGCRRAVALWARPFASEAGSAAARAQAALIADEVGELDVSFIDHFDHDPGVRSAWAGLARGAVEALPESERPGAHVLFTLQALPIVGQEDPTLPAARAFAEAVLSEANLTNPWSVAYQDGVDPRGSLGPTVQDELERLAGQKARALALVPISFATEGLASRWELDAVVKPLAKSRGIEHVVRAPCPAERPEFIAALAGVVAAHIAEMDRIRATA